MSDRGPELGPILDRVMCAALDFLICFDQDAIISFAVFLDRSFLSFHAQS
jgi:hypothetical protein